MVPALTPVRSDSSDIFNRSAVRARERASTRAAPALALLVPAFMVARRSRASARRRPLARRPISDRPRRGALGDHLRDLVPREARREQHLLGVLAQCRPGQAVVAPGTARQLHRNAQQPYRALRTRLRDLDDHLALAHQLRVERLVELE